MARELGRHERRASTISPPPWRRGRARRGRRGEARDDTSAGSREGCARAALLVDATALRLARCCGWLRHRPSSVPRILPTCRTFAARPRRARKDKGQGFRGARKGLPIASADFGNEWRHEDDPHEDRDEDDFAEAGAGDHDGAEPSTADKPRGGGPRRLGIYEGAVALGCILAIGVPRPVACGVACPEAGNGATQVSCNCFPVPQP